MNQEIQQYQSDTIAITPQQVVSIRDRIFIIRNIPVMLDRDLANLYSVDTRRINEQARRNIERFPARFRFQLADFETKELVAKCDRLTSLKHSSVNPYAYTEQGVAMLATVLKSDIAVKVSIGIMDAFVEMRRILSVNQDLIFRLNTVEQHQIKADQKIEQLFQFIENQNVQPKQGIFFNGQIFDAYQFVSELIRSAETSIILVDNYADDSVLTQLTKRADGVSATVCVSRLTEAFRLDVERHNRQYPPIDVREVPAVHDRFLLLDDTRLYTFGASFKDLGKKLFCFSLMESEAVVEAVIHTISSTGYFNHCKR